MVLVTGASGFLGGELVHQLVTAGESVRILHRKHSDLSHLNSIRSLLEFAEGDILDITSLEDAFVGIEKIYHSAAVIGYDNSYYRSMYKTNIEGTANVVNIALVKGVRKMLHVSSIAAIGGKPGEVITEDTKWENNRWTTQYGITKMLAEREIWRGIQEGMEAVIINPGIIIGTGHDEHKATIRLFKRIATGKLPFYTTGSNGFVDVADVAAGAIALMNSGIHAERFIAVSENIAFKSYFEKIAAELKASPPKLQLNPLTGKLFVSFDWLASLLTGRKRALTNELLKVSLEAFRYSNEKIRTAVNFDFIPLNKTIRKVARQLSAHPEHFREPVNTAIIPDEE
jgi:nucleoside-diphosphate-sugar epimerase